ncbi:hypothetical protein CHU_0449 [Cytophaga hutchinsonii ATCC 33406]|uniref:Uncharacterized protein n=1 Tax=Cytophaga hutchinsonii (strain ATCC 33406 / DSM 1761 / CIP 103989 / NBRC 15051 / NCIMB 9469 / D465) TaxID=269798 RepID=A0A6N4SN75_CYTH3|nr:hypothetical protein CHU_0449 [Cytophaga hutchinsonii ATCC 33406]
MLDTSPASLKTGARIRQSAAADWQIINTSDASLNTSTSSIQVVVFLSVILILAPEQHALNMARALIVLQLFSWAISIKDIKGLRSGKVSLFVYADKKTFSNIFSAIWSL